MLENIPGVEKVKEQFERVPVMVKHVAAIGITMGMWWTGYYIGESKCASEASSTVNRIQHKLDAAEERLRQLEKENFYDPFNWDRRGQDG